MLLSLDCNKGKLSYPAGTKYASLSIKFGLWTKSNPNNIWHI